MKTIFLIGVFFILSASAVHAQDASEKKGFDRSRLFYGGNLGLSFSSYSTAINITPQVGYFFNQYFAAGVGVSYAYYKYNLYNPYNNATVQTQSTSYAGINIFGRFYPIRQVFIQAQPELNYVWGKISTPGSSDLKVNEFVPSLLLGGGAAIPAGRGSIIISIMYDVIQKTYSPYFHQAVYGFGYYMGF
jgi:hypothetical protein